MITNKSGYACVIPAQAGTQPNLNYIYIVTNKRNGTLYVGVTSNLIKRIYLHKNKLIDGFTKDNHLDKLVYYESFENINSAIQREKQLKKWKRIWKLRIIEEINPEWKDLYNDLV